MDVKYLLRSSRQLKSVLFYHVNEKKCNCIIHKKNDLDQSAANIVTGIKMKLGTYKA